MAARREQDELGEGRKTNKGRKLEKVGSETGAEGSRKKKEISPEGKKQGLMERAVANIPNQPPPEPVPLGAHKGCVESPLLEKKI